MKKLLLISILFHGLVCHSQSTVILDANFEQALIDLNIDSDGLNGSILDSDAQQFTYPLNLSSKNISNLSGIEAFINLEELDCSNNNLSTLDLSSNHLLTTLSARNNNLLELNLNNIQRLEMLNIENNQLDSLDLSAHQNLIWLMCYTNNLTYLNISTNINLVGLSCGENQLTGTLDISNLMQLEFFACGNNQLSFINTDLNFSTRIFNCRKNNLSTLDLSKCFSLEQVYADSNNLAAFNIKNNFNSLIFDFHAEGNPNLYCIEVDDAFSSTSNVNWIEDSQSNYLENCNLLGVAGIENSNFKILPNPSSDWLYIKMDNPAFTQVEISDLTGKILMKKVFSDEDLKLDIRNLSPGSYLIKVNKSVQQFIKI